MMRIFDSLLISTIEHLPKWFARPFAKPYVAGETENDVVKHIKKINNKGMSATADILGEHTKSISEAKLITSQYCDLYKRIHQDSLDCNISIKPTHLGLDISIKEAKKNFIKVATIAKTYSNFLRIDMESSEVTDKTFEIFKSCQQVYSKVGVVLQAYLHRTLEDVSNLSFDNGFNSRICKGIYKEPPSIAIHDHELIIKNYLKIAKKMYQSGAYSGFATHNQGLIDNLLDWISKEKIPKNCFEFQVLYGVPMEGRLEYLVNKNFKVRVYVPYGKDWFDYSIRRLKENPDIAGYVLRNIFKKN
jgi:proline dehydrogenase